MEYWKDADEARDTFVKLYENARDRSEKLKNAMISVNQLIWYDYTVDGPDCSFFVDCRNGQITIGKGHPGEEPDLTMRQSADIGHKSWSNKANVMMLMTRGQIVVKGMATKLLKLTPLLNELAAIYKDTLTELGMEDKILK